MQWSLFCRVIDNLGDIGVCWRLAAELAARGDRVRLWVDDASALAWMAPGGQLGVEVLPWQQAQVFAGPCGDAVIEAFGCDPPAAFVAAMAAQKMAQNKQPVWINLEYLSAEAYVERSHGLPSPVTHGPGAGLVKHFVYPGFSPRTGGLLREADLLARQAQFNRNTWRCQLGIAEGAQAISLFCYEPPGLAALLRAWAASAQPVELLLTPGRAMAAAEAAVQANAREAPGWNRAGRLVMRQLPWLSQRDYDHLLWACDLNFVRGEDSLVRALWAGQPFVWQLYPQDDGAHQAKLEAFLHWLQPPPSLAAFLRQWNGLDEGIEAPGLSLWQPAELPVWGTCARHAQQRAHALPDLGQTLRAWAAAVYQTA